MRYPEDHKAQTRQAILASAANRFRGEGIGAVGVASLMSTAGLTHGGFYAHFPSKDALVAEACTFAFQQTLAGLRGAMERAPVGKKVAAVVTTYVSAAHRDHPSLGCFAAAVGDEVVRLHDAAREELSKGVEALVALLQEACDLDADRRDPRQVLALMFGALVLSRMSTAPAAAAAFLRAARLG